MNQVAFTIVLSVWLAALCWTDCTSRRLPNPLTLGGAGVFLAWRLGAAGLGGLADGFAGGLVCGLFLILPFILRSAGGGDVKMLFAAGCAMGLRASAAVILFTSLSGLALMFAMLVAGAADGARLKHFARSLFDPRYDRKAGRESLPPKTSEKCRVPFGLAIAAGTWLALITGVQYR